MRLPVLVRRRAEITLARFCRDRVPSAKSDQVRLEYEIPAHTAILVERLGAGRMPRRH